jgi:hypothetical protein
VSQPEPLRLKGQHDIVAAVPYLVGFHPEDSLVCIVLDGGRVRFVARLDLPASGQGQGFPQAAVATAEMISHHGTVVIIVGYGVPDRVDPVADLFTAAFAAVGVDVFGALRVTAGRYYCLNCDGACPADGVAYEPTASPIPAEAVYRGLAPLPSRTALQELIEPVTGGRRSAMRAASEVALRRLASMLHEAVPARTGASIGDWLASGPPAHVVEAGVAAVRQAFAVAARGEELPDADAAWLTAVLLIPDVRDRAWTASDGSDAQRRLWIDITRRAISATTAAPACLLAITAYLGGDGALAHIAVDRALHANPGYSLARLLTRALQAGVPPEMWREATTGT